VQAPDATVYMAVYVGDPEASGVEVAAGDYARQAITFAAPSAGTTSNTGLINFTGSAAASWGTVTHFAVCSAATAGTRLFSDPLVTPKTVGAGGDLSFAVGEVRVAWAAGAADRNYMKHNIINHFLRNSAATPAATLYLSVLQAEPAADGTGGSEVTAVDYARKAVAFAAPTSGVLSNSGTVTFTTSALNAWGTGRWYGIHDALTAGNMLCVLRGNSDYAISVGTPLVFGVGSISYTAD
jgi:hypothetical protein